MSRRYKIVKAFLMFDEDGTEVPMIGTILTFHGIWRSLTKTQRAVLQDQDPISHYRAVTLDKLRERKLIDDDNGLTLLGEAVVHYRPDGPIGYEFLALPKVKAVTG